MAEDLVDHGFDLGSLWQTFNISDLEVGYTDCLQLSCLVCILKGLPCSTVAFYITVIALVDLCPGLRRMDDHHVQIRKSHLLQSIIDTFCSSFISLVLGSNLGYHKQFLSRNTTGSHAFTYTTLISISLRSIKMSVAKLCGRLYGIGCFSIFDKPCSQSKLWNVYTII